MMNLSTLNTVVSALSAVEFENKEAVMEALTHEVELVTASEARNAERKASKLAQYADAHAVVMDVLTREGKALTVAEIWEEVGEALEGFTKGQLSYALSRLWVDEVEKTAGKVNAYAIKA